jgi:tetratricopeptide (TPR) repeat protein
VLAQLEGSPLGEAHKEWTQTALYKLGLVMRFQGNLADAEIHLRRAITLGQEREQPARALALLYFQLGDALLHQGRYAELVQSGEEGLALLGADTECTEAGLLNVNMGHGYRLQGHADEGWACYRRNVRLLKKLPYSPSLAVIIHPTIPTLLYDKDLTQAQEVLQAVDSVAQQHREDRLLVGAAQSAHSFILFVTGDLRGAVTKRETRLGNTPVHDAITVRIGWSLLADNYLVLGNVSRAAEYAEKAHNSLMQEGVMGGAANNARQLGVVALCTGAVGSAVGYLEAALRSTGRAHAEASVSLGRAYLAAGRRTEALRQFEEVLATGAPDDVRPDVLPRPVPLLPNALSGIDEASGSSDRVRALVQQLRAKHPGASLLPILACLEPATVRPALPHHVHEDFTLPLSMAWIWHDPFSDCSWAVEEGLELCAANGRDLWLVNLSTPRMLQPAPSSDFVVQTSCGPASDEQPAIGGLLLWQDQQHYLVLERGHWGAADIAFRGCLDNVDRYVGRGRLMSEQVWLRLERRGGRIRALCSADGQAWLTAGEIEFVARDGEQVGVHAIGMIDRTIYHGAYPEGTTIRFACFDMWTAEAT